jgi:hypothetical protein
MNTVWCDRWKSNFLELRERIITLEEALRAAANSLQIIAGAYNGKGGLEDLVDARQYAASRARLAKKALDANQG